MGRTSEQWNRIETIIIATTPEKDPRGLEGRYPREVLNGIIRFLRTGVARKEIRPRYPPYQTRHRRFQQYVRQGTFRLVAYELAQDLYERGEIDIREAFVDGTYVPAKKGSCCR